MTRDPRIDPEAGDELHDRVGQLRRVIRRDGDILWCQGGTMRYRTTVQRWREWSIDNSEQAGSFTLGIRDPRLDPWPGDILRHPNDQFPRKVLARHSDRVLVEMSAQNRRWHRTRTWRKWAAGTDVVIQRAVEKRKMESQSD
jgi:hypothetical protein